MNAEEVKIYTPEDIPNKNDNMEDWYNVIKCMLHRHCSEINPGALCCKNNDQLCEHSFPKYYALDTKFKEEDGWTVYRRRILEGGGKSHVAHIVEKK